MSADTPLFPDDTATTLARVRSWLQGAERVALLTGAGVSAESGVPTFRDAQSGHWARFRPEDLATEEAFRRHPERVWRWYAERRQNMGSVQPNAGHLAVAAFEQRHPGRLTLITQNVDGLHQRAGSRHVLALHGNLFEDRWLSPCPLASRAQAACDVAEAQAQAGEPPRCAQCGNLLRPGVVWFGEMLPPDVLQAAEAAAENCQLMLVAGTSGAVWPAAGLAVTARRAGAKVVILNPAETELDDQAHAVLRGTSATLLPAVLDAQ